MIDIREDDFSADEALKRVRRDDAGAVVVFVGTVRDDGIEAMELEAYRTAAVAELQKIRDEAVEKFDLLEVDIIHRVGRLSVGDNIALIACSAPHRKEAFDGCSYILEELKKRAPIWKKELKKEGDRWVGMESS